MSIDYSKIEQPGLVSEYQYETNFGEAEKIFYPVMGRFVTVTGDPKSLRLYDSNSRIFHPLSNVAFLWSTSSPLEGEKKFPRPFVYEEVNGKFALIKSGEEVKISYIGGSIYNPLVEGAVERLSIINQKKFLRLDPNNLDRQPERYETDDYVYEFENDGHGELKLRVEAKKQDDQKGNKGGTGNITIDLTGTETNGKVTVNLNGAFTVNQKNADGKVVQSVKMDNTKDANKIMLAQVDADGNAQRSIAIDGTKDDEKIILTDKHENTIEANKNGVFITSKLDVTVETKGDATVNASGNAIVKGKKILLNNGQGKVLTDLTATPACLFTGKPFPGVQTVEAG